MIRKDMAKLAQDTANAVVLPEPGVRVAVIVTDAEGKFIGVGTNSTIEDAKLLFASVVQAEGAEEYYVRKSLIK